MIYQKEFRRLLSRSTALGLLSCAAVGTALVVPCAPAAAQDYTSGAVTGSVVNSDNKPVAGAVVTLRSTAQNQTRTLTSGSNGSFSAVGLPPGQYDVIVKADGYRDTTGTITIAAAQESRLTFTVVSTSASSDIVVTGQRVRQDFTKTTTGLNVNVPDLLARTPIGRSVTAVALLAPGAVLGASGFGNVPSLGGSSVAENAYYINGLNITNPDTYVGSTRVPFDFYNTIDVQTGGYPAEFGRATGGVINATTKSGSNTPFMAIHGNFQPAIQSPYSNTGLPSKPDNVGRFGKDYDDSLTIEAGGALIKDHVFFYGLVQPRSQITERAYNTAGYYERDKSTTPFYGGKADAFITPTQHLEFTFFDTTNNTSISRYAFTSNTNFTGGTIGALSGTSIQRTGGFNWVGRYTGNITDFFTISGAYGINKDSNDSGPADATSYYVEDRRTATVNGVSSVISSQKFQTSAIDDTQRKFYRIDGDLRFSLIGRHHVRFGMDNEDLSMTKIDKINGTVPLSYSYRDRGVVVTYERLGGQVSARDRAFYLQDSWDAATGLTINLGVRDDEFNQVNLSGQKYLDFKGNIAARAGFSYVPNGDSNFSFKGSYGRYFIPPAMNLGFRGRDLYFQEYFNYPTGITAATFPTDPKTGLPLINLGGARTDVSGFGTACPTDISAAPGSPVNGTNTCAVYGSGLQDPAYAKIAPNAKATYEDEAVLGVRFRASHLLSFGLTGTYRALARVSEDTDFGPQISAALGCGTAAQTGTATQCNRYLLGNTYYIWNPGSSSITLVDWTDPTKRVTLTGLTFPKPKRTYEAVVFDFSRADDGVWNLAGSVTISRSKGNYEGTVASDVGKGVQADAGSGIAYDYPGLAQYTYGLLPNDRAVVAKLFGGYHVTNNFLVGTNLLVQSPMHGSCEGYNPSDPYATGYGSLSFYCGTGPLNADGNYTTSAPSPRGTGWKTDWLAQVDLSVRYTLPQSLGLGKGLTLRADVFNVFDSQAVTNRNPEHENDSDGSTYFTPNPAYRTPNAYQVPRYFRFGFDWAF